MIRIALADDHKMFAKGIASLLEEDDDFRIEGIFSNGLELLEFLKTHEVDVVLTDMNMPFLDGAGVIESVKRFIPNSKVVVLSMYDDEAIFLKCQKLGADAYVLKNADSDELIYTIKEVDSYKKKPLTLLCKDISQVPCRRAPRAGRESAGRGAKTRRAESSRKILHKGCVKRDVSFCQNP